MLILEIGEECDDGNLEDGDGCSHDMLIEEGWLCDGLSPTTCDAHGNGNLTMEIGEECDDGNLEDGVGCSHDMLIEDTWICDGASPTTCD